MLKEIGKRYRRTWEMVENYRKNGKWVRNINIMQSVWVISKKIRWLSNIEENGKGLSNIEENGKRLNNKDENGKRLSNIEENGNWMSNRGKWKMDDQYRKS